MTRTDRLLGVLLELQSRRAARAEDLAEHFETSKRTIYRDIQALCETGVPIVAQPGVGYSIMDGYFLPPVSFTPDEATMLVLGAEFIAGNFDAQYRAAARTARSKIEAVLSPRTRADVRAFQERIALMVAAPLSGKARDFLPLLRRAVLERKRLRLLYRTRHAAHPSGEENWRETDPYALVNWSGLWYLVGYCHLRQAIRNFRADRIVEVQLCDRTFQRPISFQLHEEPLLNRSYTARVFFVKDIDPWVRESMSFYATEVTETNEGLLVTLRAHQEAELLQWILSWGAGARVLEPETLKQRILEEARKMLQTC
jgi:predicted DNA-binding transcriptional regulator YafY